MDWFPLPFMAILCGHHLEVSTPWGNTPIVRLTERPFPPRRLPPSPQPSRPWRQGRHWPVSMHHFEWENSQKMAMFNSYMLKYQRVSCLIMSGLTIIVCGWLWMFVSILNGVYTLTYSWGQQSCNDCR